MANYRIITDSACDLWADLIKELDITVVPLTLNFRGESREDSVESGMGEFFDALRAGEAATTSAVNPDRWAQAMEPVLAAGEDVLVIAFSSGLSTTYQSAEIAAGELREKYPERTVCVVDSRCASLGQGLLVWYACKKRDAGMDIRQLAQWLDENRFHLCHWFTVDDLMYLKRGGRISATTAVVGTMLKIKPVLHMDDAGHLINMSKARGRKASINALADKMGELGLPGENDTVFICQGDCLEDAHHVADRVREKFGAREFYFNDIGPVIGSHTGCGCVSIFFLGERR